MSTALQPVTPRPDLASAFFDQAPTASQRIKGTIAGRITFAGEWPDGVAEVAVAVYEDLPGEPIDLLRVKGWDTQVELHAPAYDYLVQVEHGGVYRWVVVAWHREGASWDFTSLLGCHHSAGDSLPTPVAVRPGEIAAGVDIAVDFGVLRGEIIPGHDVCLRPLPPELLELAGSP